MHFFFFLLSFQGLRQQFVEVEFAQQKKEEKGKEQMVGMGEEKIIWRNDILQNFFHCDLVSSLMCSPLSKGCLQVQMVVLLSSYFFFLHCSKFQQWFVLRELLTSYSLPFLSCYSCFFGGFLITPFILILQTRLSVGSSMFFSIYKIFKFKWWYHDHLAIYNIATSFINDFLKQAPLFHLAFVMILLWFRKPEPPMKSVRCNTFTFIQTIISKSSG